MLKVGREEIAGLVAALESYVERDHEAEDARALALAAQIAERLHELRGADVSLVGPPEAKLGRVVIDFSIDSGPSRAAEVSRNLRNGSPRVFCLDTWLHQGFLIILTSELREDELPVLVERMIAVCEKT
jgi:L-seryl-tRNA(Ser) seleniumtransferase